MCYDSTMTSKYDKERAHPRFPIPTLVDLQLEDGSYRHDFSVNVSQGGMYLESDRVLSSGTKATLRFVLPNLDWVFEIFAEVTWVVKVSEEEKLDGKKDGYGLIFTSMDDKDREKLTTYLKNFKIEDLEL